MNSVRGDVSMQLPAVHGRRERQPAPVAETALADALRREYSPTELTDLYGRFASGEARFDQLMRRVIWQALAIRVGAGLRIGAGATFRNLERCEIGEQVFIGAGAYLQGQGLGRCVIGDHVWIGPGSFLDARDLVIEEYVGWGPGARLLGSEHTGHPIDEPIIATDLNVRPVRIGAWADIGTNATVLPGVAIGKGSIVGAGAVVSRDVPPFAIVAGVPARFIRWREGYDAPVPASEASEAA
jgi:acetyltransferase-like isoleucine patch superfamily enzyme